LGDSGTTALVVSATTTARTTKTVPATTTSKQPGPGWNLVTAASATATAARGTGCCHSFGDTYIAATSSASTTETSKSLLSANADYQDHYQSSVPLAVKVRKPIL